MSETSLIRLSQGRHLDSMWLSLLLFQIIKVAASVALALAYHSKLREPAAEGREDAKPESGHNTSSELFISNPSDHEEEDDEDEDEEDEKKKKRTVADWPSIIFRFRCMMPLILPRRSPLSYILISR